MAAQSTGRPIVGRLLVVAGSITGMGVDAIVIVASARLFRGGGVDSAIDCVVAPALSASCYRHVQVLA